MKTMKRTGVNGKEITYYIPETREDARKLDKMEQAGMMDGRQSFGDGGCVSPLPGGKPHKSKNQAK